MHAKYAEDLKKAKYAGYEGKNLEGKNIALILKRVVARTRCSFEVGAKDEGAHVSPWPIGWHIGHKDVKDYARVLGGMFDGIECRGFSQRNVEILAESALVYQFGMV
ncbi:hypothetical protein ACW18Q_02435 [Limosilactobacillus reuteri]